MSDQRHLRLSSIMQPGHKIGSGAPRTESVVVNCIPSGLSRFPLKTSRPFAMLVFLGADLPFLIALRIELPASPSKREYFAMQLENCSNFKKSAHKQPPPSSSGTSHKTRPMPNGEDHSAPPFWPPTLFPAIGVVNRASPAIGTPIQVGRWAAS